MVQRWKQWCRLCAREDGADYMYNALIDKKIHEAIRKYFSINIRKYDRLPQNICSKCHQLISTLICFSKKAVKAQEMFSEFLISLDDIDHRQLKAQYGLQELDENDDEVLNNSACSELYKGISKNITDESKQTVYVITDEDVDGDDRNTCLETENIDPDTASTCDISTHAKEERSDEGENTDVYDANSCFKAERVDDDENTDVYDVNAPVKEEPADEDENTDVYDANAPVKVESIDENEITDVYDVNTPVKEEPVDGDENMDVYDVSTPVKEEPVEKHENTGVCDTNLPTNIDEDNDVDVHDMNARIICTDCDKIFLTNLALRCHMQLEHGATGLPDQGRFPCTKCGRNFKTPGHLQHHARSHLPPEQRRMVPCPYCGRPFPKMCALQIHLKSFHFVA